LKRERKKERIEKGKKESGGVAVLAEVSIIHPRYLGSNLGIDRK
jgi:hypothetical protein